MAPIKSSLARTVGKLFGVQKDSDLSLRGDVQSNRKISSSVQASGGTEIVTATKKYHVFLGSSEQNFTVTNGGTCEVLVVAGGGSGGYFYGAGGGKGGLTTAKMGSIWFSPEEIQGITQGDVYSNYNEYYDKFRKQYEFMTDTNFLRYKDFMPVKKTTTTAGLTSTPGTGTTTGGGGAVGGMLTQPTFSYPQTPFVGVPYTVKDYDVELLKMMSRLGTGKGLFS